MRQRDFPVCAVQLVEKQYVKRVPFGFKYNGEKLACTYAMKKGNITCFFLINKTKLMPQGNFAKCTIYINAFF